LSIVFSYGTNVLSSFGLVILMNFALHFIQSLMMDKSKFNYELNHGSIIGALSLGLKIRVLILKPLIVISSIYVQDNKDFVMHLGRSQA
jgi:hypothetical protein